MTKHIILTITALATVGLAACGDVSTDDLRDALIDQGVDEEAAGCVAEYMEENLSEDDFQAAAKADTVDEMPEGSLEVVTDAILECGAL